MVESSAKPFTLLPVENSKGKKLNSNSNQEISHEKSSVCFESDTEQEDEDEKKTKTSF